MLSRSVLFRFFFAAGVQFFFVEGLFRLGFRVWSLHGKGVGTTLSIGNPEDNMLPRWLVHSVRLKGKSCRPDRITRLSRPSRVSCGLYRSSSRRITTFQATYTEYCKYAESQKLQKRCLEPMIELARAQREYEQRELCQTTCNRGASWCATCLRNRTMMALLLTCYLRN